MKQNDISIFSNSELQDLRKNLILSSHANLPDSIKKYIEAEKLVGNKSTRIMRLIHLIDNEIVKRTVKSKIIFKETFNKGVEIDKNDILDILKSKDYNTSIEIIDRGKYDNDNEFMTIRLIIKK